MLRLLWTLVSSIVISAMILGPIMTVHAQEVEEFVVNEGVFLSKENFEIETRVDRVVEEEPVPTTEIVEEPVTVVEVEPVTIEVEEPVTIVEVEPVTETPFESPVVIAVVGEPAAVTAEVGEFVIITPAEPKGAELVRVFDGTFFGFNQDACQAEDAVVCIAAAAGEELEDVVDEANEELKKKLKELQDDIEEDLADNDAEEQRRQRHPERGRNIKVSTRTGRTWTTKTSRSARRKTNWTSTTTSMIYWTKTCARPSKKPAGTETPTAEAPPANSFEANGRTCRAAGSTACTNGPTFRGLGRTTSAATAPGVTRTTISKTGLNAARA